MTLLAGSPLRRHDLVAVAPADWSAALARSEAVAGVDEAARKLLADWAATGRPAIVRRRAEGEDASAVPLAVPLPPSHGKARVALSLPAWAAMTRVAPPAFAAVLAGAPPAWRAIGRAIADLGADVGIAPRAFGSLLWGALTGLDYLGPASDLDLLWPVTPATDLARLLAGLARIDGLGIVPIDGEILLPDGAGVQWRELDRALREPGGRVLAKAADGVSLRRADALFPA